MKARSIDFTPNYCIDISIATASVDAQSDGLIQHALQTQFTDTTILCIAHRISTLVWMDRIMVMEDGRIVEEGGPKSLLENEGGRYRAMVGAGGGGLVEEILGKLGSQLS
jgi:ABC-type multidrug transport system fused ATPase/permease subunit